MITIDIITLSGLTAVDGSEVASGATIKFESTFYAGSSNVYFRLKLFRNREIFEAGYEPIRVEGLPEEFNKIIPDEIFYTMTPSDIYTIVKNALNEFIGIEVFDVLITDTSTIE